MNYYNEFDPKAAAWLRELIKAKLIPAGDVDERSILNVPPQEVKGYTQCHFFAGIGGWSFALQLAGWSSDRPVWTGSCPCQPFSKAGKQKGVGDSRHLWPAFFNLIRECRPNVIFGEQVKNAIKHGWLDGISDDLERENYSLGASVFGACSVRAPHIRPRLYWMAVSDDNPNKGTVRGSYGIQDEKETPDRPDLIGSRKPSGASDVIRPWDSFEILQCRDGKRRIEPGTYPLVNGVSPDLGLMRGYGNAIVPQQAAEFILAGIETGLIP